jgi:hypothetical protein
MRILSFVSNNTNGDLPQNSMIIIGLHLAFRALCEDLQIFLEIVNFKKSVFGRLVINSIFIHVDENICR